MKHAYDVIVIGGGHAGTEAAAAAARVGAKTALLTHSAATIGAMSCNPAIGGLGKGHLVREIDALDGVMALAADRGGIQFRVLNRRKGPAVRGPRAQADRKLYARAVQEILAQQANLTIVEADATRILVEGGRVVGVETSTGDRFGSATLVLTTGTFLNGLTHVGELKVPAGRYGEAPSIALARSLAELGLPRGRLKTGTPPRLDGRTIDWASVDRQEGDDPPEPFSMLTERIVNPQVSCGVTRTSAQGHAIIRANLHRAPMYSGDISSRGPRYCPSIEDKVVRFADRESHQIFLEPEGLDDDTVYPNGISTSLPEDVQHALVASIAGLEKARIVRAGYAVEYDFVDPRALDRTLEVRDIGGLFLAGQINGTTGYEEAGAQGLVAGLNAALMAGGSDLVTFDRSESYLGVLIDDLTTHGVSEPYRMFTSRAEFRLSLRADNADERLTGRGLSIGCVGALRSAAFESKRGAIAEASARLRALSVTPTEARRHGLSINQDGTRRTAAQLLSYPGVTLECLRAIWPELSAIPVALDERLETDAIYAVYLDRQAADVAAFRQSERIVLPSDLDYNVPGLSSELQAKLEAARPTSLGQASRIEGMTPAALTLLAALARRTGSQGSVRA